MDYVPVLVKQDVPVVPVLNLQQVGDNRVSGDRLHEVAASFFVPTRALRRQKEWKK